MSPAIQRIAAVYRRRVGGNSPTATHPMGPGSYYSVPAGPKHFAFATGETIIRVPANGPWGVPCANLQDDPRNAKKP